MKMYDLLITFSEATLLCIYLRINFPVYEIFFRDAVSKMKQFGLESIP